MNRVGTATHPMDREKAIKEHHDTPLVNGEIYVSPEVLEQWNKMSMEEKNKFEKKLLWKLDLRLVPWLSLLYLLSFLDRTNIGNAKIQGVYFLFSQVNAVVGYRSAFDEHTI